MRNNEITMRHINKENTHYCRLLWIMYISECLYKSFSKQCSPQRQCFDTLQELHHFMPLGCFLYPTKLYASGAIERKQRHSMGYYGIPECVDIKENLNSRRLKLDIF